MSATTRDNGVVSIVIPCYNSREYVGDAIKSSLQQTYERVEVIVIDDGSTDGSIEVIRSFGDRITWKSGENRGAPAARNWGLELASGEFVKFLDADDILVRQAVEEQVSFTQTTDHNKIVYGSWGEMDSDGSPFRIYPHKPREEGEHPVCYWLENNAQTMTPLHRQRFLNDVGGFDEDLIRGQEYDLHLRLVLKRYELQYEDNVVGFTRQHESESRIENREYFSEHPFYHLEYIIKKYKMLRKNIEKRLPPCTKKILSQEAWQFGRKALRLGQPSVANEYFKLSRSFGANKYMKGSKYYQNLVTVMGPRYTEKVVGLASKIKDSLSI